MSAFVLSVIVSVFVLFYGRYTYAVPYYVRADPPYFYQQPQSSRFLPGNNRYTVTLTCAVHVQNIISGYNMVEMYWVFNGSIVEDLDKISSDTTGQSTLTFHHPVESNVGKYHCVMQDGLFSIVSQIAELTLYEFSGFIEPALSITAYHGDNIYIDCRAITNALQLVTWNKDLQSLQLELNQTKRIVAMPDGVLIISNVSDLDAGNYTCRLTILSQFKEKTVEVKIKTAINSSQLKFLYKPQNRSVLVNESNVYLLCVATGNVLSYTWLKDSVSVQDSGIEYQLAAGGSILNFTNVTDRIQGVYSCVVESEASQIIQSTAWIHLSTPPVIDGSMSTSDFPIEIDGVHFFETLHCHIKRCSPPPTVVWLHNGIPIDINNTGIIIFAQRVLNTAVGFDYTLEIISANSTYQFVLDNIIGMYQCIVGNEAGHVIISQRVLFRYKPNPVDQPILHNPVCDNGCSFLVEWNHTDHYYFSKSQRNYIVYMSIDGVYQRTRGCINKHSTSCVVRYDITEIRFGKYTAAVQAVFSIEDELPDRVSDLSEFSNMVQLNHMTYPNNAVKPCEMSCRSFITQDSEIHMDVSWNLCPYEDFSGYVDNYVVILDCSADYPHAPSSILNYTASPGLLNYTFQQVPCFRNCKLVVKKLSSNFKANSNSSITCGRTPKLRPQSAVYNVSVKRAKDPDVDIDVGNNFMITFDLPPLFEMCSSDDVARILIKWKGYNNTEHLQSFDTGVLAYMGHGSVPLKVGDEDRWKAVSIAVSFTTSVGFSPWSEWHNVSSAINGDIKRDDVKFKVNGITNDSITFSWILSTRAESMRLANFIMKFQYAINLTSTTNELITSLDENYTFYNLSAGTTYHIVGKVITSDNVTDPPTNLVINVNGRTLDLIESTTGHEPIPTVSNASKEGLSDRVIIVITVCVAMVILVFIFALICRWKCGKCRANKLAMQSNVVSHHLLTKNGESSETSTEPSTQSDIGVPTTPKKELVKQWLNSADRNNPPGSDGQHATYLEEPGRSEVGQDNEINYMLNQIISKPSFVLEAVPKRKKVTRAEVHRLPVESELESSYFTLDKEGDYAKIAPGASTSGDSKQCVLMDNFITAPDLSSNRDETTLFSTSPKPSPKRQEYSELVVSKHINSMSRSSGSSPYLENNEEPSGDSPPYLENEQEQLLTEINGAKKHSHDPDCVHDYAGNINHVTPSILSSSYPSEGSSDSFQGEGYVSEHDMLLLNGTPNQSTYLQGYQGNQNFTNRNAIKYAQHIVDNVKPAETSSKTSSSVGSDCIGSNVNSSYDV